MSAWEILWALAVVVGCAWLALEGYRETADLPMLDKRIARLAWVVFLVGFGMGIYAIGGFGVALLTHGISHENGQFQLGE